jgi:hypothetical protein
MKKQSTFAQIARPLFLFGIILSCLAISCHQETLNQPGQPREADSPQALIQQARAFFDQQHYPTAPTTSAANPTANPAQPADTLPFSRTTLHKTPLWDQAQIDSFSFGKGVVVPINVQEPLSIRVGAAQTTLTASQITWLFMYKNPAQQWQVEVITRIPDAAPTTAASSVPPPPVPGSPAAAIFQGKVRVEDWQGNFLKAIQFEVDTILTFSQSSTYRRPEGAAPAVTPLELAPATPAPGYCNETDWYGCATIGDGPVQCDYVYTTEDCGGIVGGIGFSTNSPGLPAPPDYGLISGGSIPTAPAPTVTNIIPDATITANPIVACVYNHLMSPSLTNGLKSILSSFDDNTLYNVNFTVSNGEDSAEGVTSYKGNNTFQVTLNGSEANDPTYSRIYLASTMIHEAFHAKLRQKAIETFGEAAISQWPIPIDDMTLAELASYFEADSKANNTWESVEHDWMVNNIAQLATSLEQFVQTFYVSTYASVGSNIAPYEALMYMGLQNSTLYQEQVVATGKQATFQQYWAELNEGGKCQD